MGYSVTASDFDSLDPRLSIALQSLLAALPASHHAPKLGIVCGSGLGGLADALEQPTIVEYSAIKGWPEQKGASAVLGHRRGLAFGKLGGCEVVAQMGRMHYYEGYPIADVTFAVRIFKLLGCESVILTNAAGAVNTDLRVGQIMALYDHLSLPSLTSMNPLIGPNLDEVGPRFPPMSNAYDFELRKSLFRAARELQLNNSDVVEGTYAWVAGPTYETRAEGKFIRAAGADVVGMSTVPEVIAARHIGLRVLALSLVTNMVVLSPYRSAATAVEHELAGGDPPIYQEETANHEEVLAVGKEKAKVVVALVRRVAEGLGKE